jgi:hypothetical protein
MKTVMVDYRTFAENRIESQQPLFFFLSIKLVLSDVTGSGDAEILRVG